MLDVIIVQLAVGENVVHVVLGAPPLKAIAAGDCGHDSAVFHEEGVAVVGHRVADPAWNNLGKSEQQDAYDRVLGCAGDQ